MKSYVIHLIRNMPCEGNLEGRYIGRTESPLALESIAKLAQRKGELEYPQAQAFFASPSTRCVDTLKILYPQADPEVVLELAECDFGEFEGKTAKELEGDPRFAQWMAGGAQAAPPGGESGPVFLQRVCQGFELLVKNLMTRARPAPCWSPPPGSSLLCWRPTACHRPRPTSGCASPGRGIPCGSPRGCGCALG